MLLFADIQIVSKQQVRHTFEIMEIGSCPWVRLIRMGRYRPPEPEKTAIITAEGFSRLQQELNHLWKEKRPEVTARVAAAAALGDRSENADYIYGKKQLAEIDHRIRYLDKRIRTMNVVDRPPNDSNKIYFGAWVTLTSAKGETRHVIGWLAQTKLTTRQSTSASIRRWQKRCSVRPWATKSLSCSRPQAPRC